MLAQFGLDYGLKSNCGMMGSVLPKLLPFPEFEITLLLIFYVLNWEQEHIFFVAIGSTLVRLGCFV